MNALPEGISSYFQSANVALSISRIGAPDDELIEVNERFCALTGRSREEMVGRNCRFLQGPLVDQPGHAAVREFMKDPARSRVRAHLINFRADDEPFVNMLTMTRLTGPAKTPRFILASQFDVTSAAPSELLDYNAELREKFGRPVKDRNEREMLLGSLQSLGEAALAITQARLLMDEADKAGMLELPR